jgi:hypothetical protein
MKKLIILLNILNKKQFKDKNDKYNVRLQQIKKIY